MIVIQSRKNSKALLPAIPNKRYFTIGEVGGLCALKPHVLRYWEQEFPQLNPVKRRGNRRYYQQKDVLMVRQIRQLLYHDGFTIEGARAKLLHYSEEKVKESHEEAQVLEVNTVNKLHIINIAKNLIVDLEMILQKLK